MSPAPGLTGRGDWFYGRGWRNGAALPKGAPALGESMLDGRRVKAHHVRDMFFIVPTMKRLLPALALILSLLFAAPSIGADQGRVEGVCFTPGEDCTAFVTTEIRGANREILVQAYGFTNPAILEALADAKKRGVEVWVILDKSNRAGRYSGATYMVNHNIPVFIDARPAIAHNKVMIFDGARVLTGSFNFTKAADKRNAENIVTLSGEVAAAFAENWRRRFRESEPY